MEIFKKTLDNKIRYGIIDIVNKEKEKERQRRKVIKMKLLRENASGTRTWELSRIEELTQEIMERYGQMAVEDSLVVLGYKDYPDIFNKSNELLDAIQRGDNFEVEEDEYLQAVMGEEGFNVIKEIVKSNNMVSLSDFEEYQKYNLLEEQAWNKKIGEYFKEVTGYLFNTLFQVK